jgi:hypothetical protein
MGKVALITAVVLLKAANARQEPSKNAVEVSAKKVKGLQTERIACLKSAADVSMRLAQKARIELSDALEDRMTLLAAELDAAETESERLSLYRKAVDSLSGLEEVAKARMEAARGTELNLHRIKARRLEVEIQLERAKIKGLK